MSVLALDWERGTWSASLNGKKQFSIGKNGLLTQDFPDVDCVVVESAHMQRRNIYSVAQVYDENELRSLPFADKLRLFPERQLSKAAKFAGNVDKDGQVIKEKDAESIAKFAVKHPEKLSAWRHFRFPGEEKSRHLWEARDAFRADIASAVNQLRYAWNNKLTEERYALPEVQAFIKRLDRIYDDVPEHLREMLGIKRGRNGLRVKRMSVALTLYLCVFTRNDVLRVRPDGKFIGVRFILDAIGMSHSRVPNLARSQLVFHGMRHFDGTRAEYMRNVRQFLALMRDS